MRMAMRCDSTFRITLQCLLNVQASYLEGSKDVSAPRTGISHEQVITGSFPEDLADAQLLTFLAGILDVLGVGDVEVRASFWE